MTKAIGMFGSDTAAFKLHVTLRNARVHLERHNFRHPDDILARLAEAPEIAAVVLVENAMRSHDADLCATLEALRNGDPTVRIIFIRDTPEREYNFELWCYQRGIYDILYPSRHTDVSIDAMRDAILRGRIPNCAPTSRITERSIRTSRCRGWSSASRSARRDGSALAGWAS